MKTEDIIKYGAMALAAYLLWQWLTKPGGLLAGATQSALPAPGTDAGAGAGASPGATGGGGGARQGSTATTPPPVSRPSDPDIHASALSASNAGKTGGWKTSMYEWNFFRMQAAQALGWSEEEIAAKTQADLGDSEFMSLPYTSAEYHAALNAKGLEGLGYSPGWGGGSAYGFQ